MLLIDTLFRGYCRCRREVEMVLEQEHGCTELGDAVAGSLIVLFWFWGSVGVLESCYG